jgi:predicted GNAT family N-acyltransferase
MKSMPLLALLISICAIIIALVGRGQSLSKNQINHLVDERLVQREKELVAKSQAKLQQIEEDFGLEPSNAATLEDMAKSLGRIIFMPKP